MSESGSLVENDIESVKQTVQTPTEEDAGKEQDVILDESDHSCAMEDAASNLNCSQEALQGRRVRKLTEKGQELQEEQMKRLERRFNSNYERWKALVKDAKQSFKTCNSNAVLQEHAAKIRKASTELEQIYEDIRRVQTPHQDMRRRIDTCEEVTKEIVEAANGCLASNKQEEDFKSAKSLKLRPDTQSIISGHSKYVRRSHVSSVISSGSSSLSSLKRQDAAAEAAANEATLEVLHEQEEHFKELQRLEAEDKRLQAEQEAAAAQLRVKQEAENEKRRQTLAAKRREIERLETVKKLMAAKAREEVYAQSICSDEEMSELLHGCGSVRLKKEATTQNVSKQHSVTPQAVTHSSSCNVKREDETTALIRALAESVVANRLPVPEPVVFIGDPLRYNDWKTSFRTLIDRKNIPGEEKIYYLRKYIGGPAKKAIESYFMLGTEAAYLSAWTILEERYGNPFLIAKAFRDRLATWPKLNPKNSLELQEFVDFLRRCEAAMSQIKGLDVLNDCNENQKLLIKLPDWLTSRWNRKVMEVEEESQTFPTFSQFVAFLTREAKIACNPVTSLNALKPSEGERTRVQRNRSPGRKALATNSDEKAVPASCVFCERANHSLDNCREFMEREVSERHKFIQENRLCFGCLKPGHRSKECEKRKTCKKCNKKHPTCLHENRSSDAWPPSRGDTVMVEREDSIQDKADSVSSRATSNRIMQRVKGTHTSTVIPVWVSTTHEPDHEVLVYALLDTQSDTTFILKETAEALHAKSEPVQLKLSTMASKDTRISCQKITGLQVRGFHSNKTIPLPATYSREFIPGNREHIPTPNTAKAWPHLEHLSDEIAPLQSCDIGLLIGYNCPQALVPRQVVSGREHQPFAIKTDLGWSVIGYGDPHVDCGDLIGASHHVIVTNRVQRIKQSTEPVQWRYLTSEDNPADYASRGLTAQQLKVSNWFTGPAFLWQKELPSEDAMVGEISTADPEVKEAYVHDTQVHEDVSLLDCMHKFSDWSRLVRAVARLTRRVKQAKGLQRKSNEATTLEERREAESMLIRMVQRDSFAQEIQHLRLCNGDRTEVMHKLQKLSPFLDKEGVLRVGGRLTHAALHSHVKHPAILPRDSYLSSLLIKHYHERVHHQGRALTMNELRANGIWILGCSKSVSSYIHKCTRCRKLRRSPEQQKMADLPVERTKEAPPFTYCGMDCFGPFYVREGRKELKRYGLLLTCMASRAVHIEMLDDLSTDSFINVLRAAISIRGPIRQIRCDQGTNFIGARREFAEALTEMKEEKFRAEGCEFIMNTSASSHMGGVWERQIRTIRSVLTSILEQSSRQLDCSSLRTFLYEVMAVINSRPLTTDYLCDASCPEPLTPNHILTMKSTVIAPPPGRFVREDLYLRKRWRRVQFLANSFWLRWKREYLLNLQHRQKWTKEQRNAKVNDIVLLLDDMASRSQWKLAKVTEVLPGKDGRVRKLKLLISDPTIDSKGRRTSKPTYLERPIQKTVTLLEAE